MHFTLDLEYRVKGPQPDVPFTERSFIRRSVRHHFDSSEVGVALVDIWNAGWADGPIGTTLGPELSTEYGSSHAARKQEIVRSVIAPTVNSLRQAGIQIFHCMNADLLANHYPHWLRSTTAEERAMLHADPLATTHPGQLHEHVRHDASSEEVWPPPPWVQAWRNDHADRVCNRAWQQCSGQESYTQLRIPAPLSPHKADLLVYAGHQFHRLLRQRKIRVLIYMGFETEHCLLYKSYGMTPMVEHYGYLGVVVRDGTTTPETAESLDGLWRTHVWIAKIEESVGYSISSTALMHAIPAGHP